MIKKKLMIKRIYFNPEVYYRKGAVSVLKSIEKDNILILISKTIKDLEYYDKIKSYLSGKSFQEEIISDPTQEIILNLRKKYIDLKPEVIIAIGGGKIMDSAKVLRVFLDNSNINFSDLEKDRFSENREIKLVAIPTTPSTGSEATPVAVIKNKESKIPYINDGFVPDLVILDHTFLESINEEMLFEFAADIFAHGYEGQISIASTPILKEIGKSCLKLLKTSLIKIKEEPKNTKILADILYSGYLGGIVQGNAFVGVCHALAHSLEHQINKSHSKIILHLLKPVISWTKKKKEIQELEKILDTYNRIGFENYLDQNLLKNINIERWLEDSLKDPAITTNPIRMKKENLLELINWILKIK